LQQQQQFVIIFPVLYAMTLCVLRVVRKRKLPTTSWEDAIPECGIDIPFLDHTY